MITATFLSPIGPIAVVGDDNVLLSVTFAGKSDIAPSEPATLPVLREAVAQLDAWFDGRLTAFNLPLAPARTARGNMMRGAICAIPFGSTASYGEVARAIGSGPRAIGQACRRNPFPIIVPCHRVIGAGQSLGFYSGGDGLATKQWLIDHEQRT